jgi:hypothetical protein
MGVRFPPPACCPHDRLESGTDWGADSGALDFPGFRRPALRDEREVMTLSTKRNRLRGGTGASCGPLPERRT